MAQAGVVRREDGLDVLGIERFCAGGRPDEVCENDADDLTLLAFRGGSREWSAALVAEARVGTVVAPAARTRRHVRESMSWDSVAECGPRPPSKLALVTGGGRIPDLAALLDPSDRGFAESLEPGPERDAVVASLAAYRAPEALQAGDPLPAVTVRRADDLEPIAVPELHRGRPLLLVFGSFT